MRKWRQKLFGFTRKERAGVITIVVITGCYLWILTVKQQIQPKLGQYSFNQFKNEIEAFHKQKQNHITPIDRTYDLNTITSQNLMSLGTTKEIANRIIKYRALVGEFSAKSDLLKVYGMDSALYHRISNSTVLTEKVDPIPEMQYSSHNPAEGSDPKTNEKPVTINIDSFRIDTVSRSESRSQRDLGKMVDSLVKQKSQPSYKIRQPVVIDINRASPEEWQSLYGIGPAYSKWIVQYRDALGGFYDISQVSETFRLPDSVFLSIKENLVVEPHSHYQININEVQLEELVDHPYLNYRQARVLFNYVQQHKPIQDLSSLHDIRGLDSTVIGKILPYLTSSTTSN